MSKAVWELGGDFPIALARLAWGAAERAFRALSCGFFLGPFFMRLRVANYSRACERSFGARDFRDVSLFSRETGGLLPKDLFNCLTWRSLIKRMYL